MDGVLNVHKVAGPTSHDVVDKVRRIFGQRRVGHAGTLDPMATGVLVVCLGQATRLVEYLSSYDKEYRANLRLGVATDTQDSTGTILGQADASHVTRDTLERSAEAFVGDIRQVPPMVSAVKHNGRRLYELAREGKTVERAARTVRVYSIDVADFRPGRRAEAEIVVRCSGGTYIRTLCADIGDALGCGAVMTALTRTRVGRFALDSAVEVERLAEDPGAYVIPMADALADMPAVVLDKESVRRIVHGMDVRADAACVGATVRVLSGEGLLVAVGVVIEPGVVKPRKVLAGCA